MITWQDVPGAGEFDFKEIYDRMINQAPHYNMPYGAVFVEVGAFFGRSTIYMAEQIKEKRPDIRFFVVDAWDEDWLIKPPQTPTQQAEMDEIAKHGSLFETFAYYLERSGLQKYVTVIRSKSDVAAQMFLTPSMKPHFVFIDGGHSYEQCLADVKAWMKTGAEVLAGHDYDHPDWPGVKEAVDKTFGRVVRQVGHSWIY